MKVKIAVLSGKGGAGKTLLAVNLAAVAGRAVYIDCDVEEPDGCLFFRPDDVCKSDVAVKMPFLNTERCIGCRRCVDFCRYHAIAFAKGRPFVFEEVCHSCGGCALICPEKALMERGKVIGRVERGVSGEVSVNTGILNMGEASGVPIVRELLRDAENAGSPVFIDCPPGSACLVMESIRSADYCVLVAEPTVFGVHNLGMVRELVTLLKKPFGAVINKSFDGDNPAESFCREEGIPVVGRIPFDSELGTLASEARIAVRESARFQALFSDILESVMRGAVT